MTFEISRIVYRYGITTLTFRHRNDKSVVVNVPTNTEMFSNASTITLDERYLPTPLVRVSRWT